MSERSIRLASQFKRDLKKQYLLLVSPEWADVFGTLIRGGVLDEKYKDHPLTGQLNEFRECHVKPDLLLMYAIQGNELFLARLGTHSDLFG